MSLKSFRSSNAILYVPTRKPLNSEAKNPPIRTIIFFITGNPGLISYYDEFLNILSRPYSRSESRDHISSRSLSSHAKENEEEGKEEEVIVAGFSLGGFVDSSATNTFDAAATATATNSATGKGSATASATAKTAPSPSSPEEEEFTFPPSHIRKELYSLRDQIDLSYERLVYLVGRVHEYYDGGDECRDSTGKDEQYENELENYEDIEGGGSAQLKTGSRLRTKVKVILMGHSVGAYIALEVVRLHHQHQYQCQYQHSQGLSQLQSMPSFAISSAYLLTPTILNISHSPSGRIATPLLSNIPFFPSLVQLLSSSLAYLISPDRLEVLVSRITGMRKESRALKSTVRFLGGRGMVQQALSMAGDEMREIGENSWGEEIWGISKEVAVAKGVDGGDGSGLRVGDQDGIEKVITEGEKGIEWIAPRLYFLFAKKDHWVADFTREEIIEGFRAGRKDQENDRIGNESPGKAARGPTFVVDETDGLVHAWCLEQSSIVAERVRGWIMETLEGES